MPAAPPQSCALLPPLLAVGALTSLALALAALHFSLRRRLPPPRALKRAAALCLLYTLALALLSLPAPLAPAFSPCAAPRARSIGEAPGNLGEKDGVGVGNEVGGWGSARGEEQQGDGAGGGRLSRGEEVERRDVEAERETGGGVGEAKAREAAEEREIMEGEVNGGMAGAAAGGAVVDPGSRTSSRGGSESKSSESAGGAEGGEGGGYGKGGEGAEGGESVRPASSDSHPPTPQPFSPPPHSTPPLPPPSVPPSPPTPSPSLHPPPPLSSPPFSPPPHPAPSSPFPPSSLLPPPTLPNPLSTPRSSPSPSPPLPTNPPSPSLLPPTPAPARFFVYRLIGNDMPPLQCGQQLLRNTLYALQHEPPLLEQARRLWVVNHVVNSTALAALVAAMRQHGVKDEVCHSVCFTCVSCAVPYHTVCHAVSSHLTMPSCTQTRPGKPHSHGPTSPSSQDILIRPLNLSLIATLDPSLWTTAVTGARLPPTPCCHRCAPSSHSLLSPVRAFLPLPACPPSHTLTCSEACGSNLAAFFSERWRMIAAQNEARNLMLEHARRAGAQWVLAFDGNQFLTAEAWRLIVQAADRHEHKGFKVFKVPMYRVHQEQSPTWLNASSRFLHLRRFAPHLHESQLAFRADAPYRYQPGMAYGQDNKMELLTRVCGSGKFRKKHFRLWQMQAEQEQQQAMLAREQLEGEGQEGHAGKEQEQQGRERAVGIAELPEINDDDGGEGEGEGEEEVDKGRCGCHREVGVDAGYQRGKQLVAYQCGYSIRLWYFPCAHVDVEKMFLKAHYRAQLREEGRQQLHAMIERAIEGAVNGWHNTTIRAVSAVNNVQHVRHARAPFNSLEGRWGEEVEGGESVVIVEAQPEAAGAGREVAGAGREAAGAERNAARARKEAAGAGREASPTELHLPLAPSPSSEPLPSLSSPPHPALPDPASPGLHVLLGESHVLLECHGISRREEGLCAADGTHRGGGAADGTHRGGGALTGVEVDSQGSRCTHRGRGALTGVEVHSQGSRCTHRGRGALTGVEVHSQGSRCSSCRAASSSAGVGSFLPSMYEPGGMKLSTSGMCDGMGADMGAGMGAGTCVGT
ncbi:unnamed protein product [Closterium sp. Naga37s-1]|nr:unnamed protein product [Closterium sp. Naga37s-1]